MSKDRDAKGDLLRYVAEHVRDGWDDDRIMKLFVPGAVTIEEIQLIRRPIVEGWGRFGGGGDWPGYKAPKGRLKNRPT